MEGHAENVKSLDFEIHPDGSFVIVIEALVTKTKINKSKTIQEKLLYHEFCITLSRIHRGIYKNDSEKFIKLSSVR